MDNGKRPDIFDVTWTEAYREVSSDPSQTSFSMGGITFRQNKRRSRMKTLLKGVTFILIASVSGAASAAYVADKYYSKIELQLSQQRYTYTPPAVPHYSSVSYSKNPILMTAELIGPAVVGINNSAEGFFGQIVNKSSGTGIIFREDGYIITNYHVIEGADKVHVKLASDNSMPLEATVVGYDKLSDIAIIKIEGENYPVARFGDSSKIRIGDVAIAIGNPLGEEFAGSVTAGIISATNRPMEVKEPKTKETMIYRLLQTDAAINPGNSGGPLCNDRGEVIGINSYKIGSEYRTEGMGFAISINEIKHIIQALMQEGKVRRPYFGVEGGAVGAQGVFGFYVSEVHEGSPAAESGMQQHDIIFEIDGTEIATTEEFIKLIEQRQIGDTITCKVLRNGETVELEITLKELE
jgi:serine protease Do